MVFEEDSNEDLKAMIGKEEVNMNKARLDWIMSGLNKYALLVCKYSKTTELMIIRNIHKRKAGPFLTPPSFIDIQSTCTE